MWTKLVIVLTFSLYFGISLSGSPQIVFAQADIQPNVSSNSTIVKNNTAMIDDAFDALKDSFGTFFGGN